jgi:hypothetical protein
MVHRPLSTWVAVVPLAADGVAQWDPADDVNFGDERADARTLPELAAAWRRAAVPVSLGYQALGLVREPGAPVVLELDDLARPVRVTSAGADVIARIEDGWPGADVSPADAAVLAAEVPALRDLLLTRLVADGDPPPGLFHILPWDRVDRLAQDVTGMLSGAGPGELIELAHWFAAAGSRFTAALEQLDEGLRRGEAELVREAGAALCDRLLAVRVARLPDYTRQAMAALVGALASRDPSLALASDRVAARLRGGDGQDPDPQGTAAGGATPNDAARPAAGPPALGRLRPLQARDIVRAAVELLAANELPRFDEVWLAYLDDPRDVRHVLAVRDSELGVGIEVLGEALTPLIAAIAGEALASLAREPVSGFFSRLRRRRREARRTALSGAAPDPASLDRAVLRALLLDVARRGGCTEEVAVQVADALVAVLTARQS